MQDDPRSDSDVDPTVTEDRFTDLEQALARLVHSSYPPDAPERAPAPDRSADARTSQSFAAPTLDAADLRPPIPGKPRSLLRRVGLARVAIAVCLGASAIWAWRWYGHAAAPPALGMFAPPPAQATSQARSIARPATTAATAVNASGAALAERKRVGLTVEQFAASQEQLTRMIAKLQAEKLDKRVLRRVSAHPAPPVAAPARKLAATKPVPPQAARRASTASSLSPPLQTAPQIRSETQPASAPSFRPPLWVTQP